MVRPEGENEQHIVKRTASTKALGQERGLKDLDG